MVRLEWTNSFQNPYRTYKFQFLNGAIRIEISKEINAEMRLSFNS